jgi:hypothetical protein
MASVAIGKEKIAELSRRVNEMALPILGGFDWKSVPRFADKMDSRDALGEKAILAHEHAIAEKQSQCMKAKNIPQ